MKPLPPALDRLLDREGSPQVSPTLLFARGVDTYVRGPRRTWIFRKADPKGETREERTEGKTWFLQEFARWHERQGQHYDELIARRRKALAALKAVPLTHTTDARLIVGLGLPHPTEAAILLDRFTGAPYLPGSTVKGLLRAAARAVAAGELPGEKEYWVEHSERVFGSSAGAEEEPAARGTCVFYDAFPSRWPTLEPDVLTPHYQDWYGERADVPADWESPVPVTFLTVAPGTEFTFHARSLRSAPERLAAELKALLGTALTWLGVGGKTSAGYGYFAEAGGAGTREELVVQNDPVEETWRRAYLHWQAQNGKVVAVHPGDRRTATALESEVLTGLPESFITRVKRQGRTADVVVKARDGGGRRILKILV